MKRTAGIVVIFSGIIVSVLLLPGPGSAQEGERPYLSAALQAAKWISSVSLGSEGGKSWPADPQDAESVNDTLYAGNPGVILFLLEAYYSTGDSAFLADARKGADYLLLGLDKVEGCGLYEGTAGIGFALLKVYKATTDEKYLDGARKCLKLITDRAVEAGRGVQWSATTDIISGAAGTGLFLLYAARELKDPELNDLAAKAGRHLVELGIPAGDGLKWAMDPEYPRLMPNFSHGTAGIAYFLATLYGETGEKEFLDAALAGARYLLSIARTEDGACFICHHEPDGLDLYYLGWCHGPAGTARLFYRLYQVTGDRAWMEWLTKCARGIMDSGIPEKQTPGFWNNVSICCGSAGVAEFFLDLYRFTGKPEYHDFCLRLTTDLLNRATPENGGLKWIQAEHRVRPDFLVAQTGYMQGAAGIGIFLLHLDASEQGGEWNIRLPDTPF
jgi:lantibiotic modifying enzyme